MKEQSRRDTGKTESPGNKEASQEDSDRSSSTDTPGKDAKPEPPPLRVIIEGGKPGDFIR